MHGMIAIVWGCWLLFVHIHGLCFFCFFIQIIQLGFSPALIMPNVDSHVRRLNVHEHVGMELFQRYGISVPRSVVVTDAANVKSAFTTLFPEGENGSCQTLIILCSTVVLLPFVFSKQPCGVRIFRSFF